MEMASNSFKEFCYSEKQKMGWKLERDVGLKIIFVPKIENFAVCLHRTDPVKKEKLKMQKRKKLIIKAKFLNRWGDGI